MVSFFRFIGSQFFAVVVAFCIFQLQLCNQTQLAPISQYVEPLFARIAISYIRCTAAIRFRINSDTNNFLFFRSVWFLVRPKGTDIRHDS